MFFVFQARRIKICNQTDTEKQSEEEEEEEEVKEKKKQEEERRREEEEGAKQTLRNDVKMQ
jgi:hypothetical protein